MNRVKKFLISLSVSAAAAVLIFNAEEATLGAENGISMCLGTVIPSLFLFSVLSETAYGLGAFTSGRVFRAVSGFLKIPSTCICAVVFSFIGGYPVGIRLIEKEYAKKNTDAQTARRLASFCVNAGPGFIVNTLGACTLNSVSSGICALISVFTASAAAAVISALRAERNVKNPSAVPVLNNAEPILFSETFSSAVLNSAKSMISVSSWIVLFSALESVLLSFVKSEEIKIWLRIIFEVTDGISAAKAVRGVPMCAAAVSFGGLCVFAQIYPALVKMKIPVRAYFLQRIFNAVISYAVCFLLIKIFPSAVETVSSGAYNYGFSPAAASNAVLLCASGFMMMFDSLPGTKRHIERNRHNTLDI